MPGVSDTNEQIFCEALAEAKGNMAAAARLLGVRRQVVHERVHKHAHLKLLCDEILESRKDDWERKLDEMGMEKDNVTAVLALLNARAKERGYGRNAEETARAVAGDTHYHLHLHGGTGGKLSEIDDSELDRLIAERRTASSEESEPGTIEIIPPDR